MANVHYAEQRNANWRNRDRNGADMPKAAKIAKVKYTPESFTDVKFMTAVEKAKIANAWQRLLASNFAWPQFSKAVYQHLTLHCSHIAHYDRGGFHHEWFSGGLGRARFIERFKDNFESGRFSWGAGSDYSDLQEVLYKHLVEYEPQLIEQARADHIALLESQRDAADAQLARLCG
jgi:hypothetical protein